MIKFSLPIVFIQSLILIACYLPRAHSESLVEGPGGVKSRNDDPISIWAPITKIPETSWDALKKSFSKESLGYWTLILGSTALLYQYDEDILDRVQRDGRSLGIGNKDGSESLFKDLDIGFRVPTDIGSTLYFLGDGITHFFISGGFLAYGHYGGSNRAYNTGLQIIHGMGVSTIFSQILKRATGRQSPTHKTEPRGKWRPFPSFKTYMDNIPAYDAMPSGHIMTATLTFTILRENYPEYDSYLLPLEIVWLSLLGWQMVNNGVHWASDYPLGIAMGYVFGKASARLGKRSERGKEQGSEDSTSWHVFPGSQDGVSMLNLLISY